MDESKEANLVQLFADMFVGNMRRNKIPYIEMTTLNSFWLSSTMASGSTIDIPDLAAKCIRRLVENGDLVIVSGELPQDTQSLNLASDVLFRVMPGPIHIVPPDALTPPPAPLVLKPSVRRARRPLTPSPPLLPAAKPAIDIHEDPAKYLTLALLALRRVGRRQCDWYALDNADPTQTVLGGVMHVSNRQAEKLTARLRDLGLLLTCPQGCSHVKAGPKRIDDSMIG